MYIVDGGDVYWKRYISIAEFEQILRRKEK